ncbi:MAG: hypothetical protein JWR72_560 [Flavisolibacter sp.]|nr:hypothetical protein [Flavisolibacter sp.]
MDGAAAFRQLFKPYRKILKSGIFYLRDCIQQELYFPFSFA